MTKISVLSKIFSCWLYTSLEKLWKSLSNKWFFFSLSTKYYLASPLLKKKQKFVHCGSVMMCLYVLLDYYYHSSADMNRDMTLNLVTKKSVSNQYPNSTGTQRRRLAHCLFKLPELLNLLGTLETIFNGLKHRNDRSIRKSNGSACSTRMVIHLHAVSK